MNRPFTSRSSGRLFLSGALAASVLSLGAQVPVSPAPGADAPTPLERFVVSATRSPQDPRFTPSAVTIVPLPELAASQVPDLRTALGQQPGVTVLTTGAPGGQSSVFLRGASSHQTLFVVDGIRMNDRAASYANFLGGADLAGIDRLEVLRGPQSTLYGSSAMGGVILMDTTRGCAPTTGSIGAVAGSFDTWGGSATVAGGTRTVGYSASLNHFNTANDEPENDLKQWSGSTRWEFAPTDAWLFGATSRRAEIEFQQTGSRFFPSPGFVTTDNTLTTVYAQARVAESFTSRLTLGQHDRHYTFTDSWGVADSRNRRRVVDWLNTWQATEQWEVVGGANYERSRYTVSGTPSRDEVGAVFLSTTYRPTSTVTVTAGARHDEFKSVGSATTWRTGASWRIRPDTKLRATFGTGFSAPGSDDRFGVPSWGQLPNPELQPERSRGWDVGVDHSLADERVTLSGTYFENRFRNLFEWETVDFTTFQGRIINRARATTRGVELAVVGQPNDVVRVRLAYTYLDAYDNASGRQLVRRPRNTFDGEIRGQPTAEWILGVGARVVADRVESSGPIDDFTTVRVFTSYAVRSDLLLKLRVENALDKTYDEVSGYRSLPRGAFASVEWTF